MLEYDIYLSLFFKRNEIIQFISLGLLMALVLINGSIKEFREIKKNFLTFIKESLATPSYVLLIVEFQQSKIKIKNTKDPFMFLQLCFSHILN